MVIFIRLGVEYDNGEYASNGKALTAIGADKAYTETGATYSVFFGAGVSVALIDGGTMTSHSDLVGQISSLLQSEFNQSLSQNATQAAAATVSGAAALVQEAFPYLNSKQIADILFSTAFKKCGRRELWNERISDAGR